MAVIRFDPNTPVEVALKFDSGKEVQSKKTFIDKDGNEVTLPNQMLYTLCGDDTIYVPLHVGEQITRLGIRKAELFSICKRLQGKATKWEVKRVGDTATEALTPNSFDALPTSIDSTPIERKLTTSINQAQQQKANPLKSSPSAAVATVPASMKEQPAPHSNFNPIAHTVISKLMASALIAAFDATQECERYAHAHGVEFEFQAEDVRAISNTIFIALSKDPSFGQAQKINGGAQPWQQ